MLVSEFAIGGSVPCHACGRMVKVAPETVRPAHSPDTSATQQAPSAQHRPASPPPQQPSGPERCARCGRPFRGDWDRFRTSIGIICNICRNLVQPADPGNPASGYVAAVDTIKLEPEAPPPDQFEIPEDEEHPWYERYRPSDERMRQVALFSGLAIIVITIFLVLTEGFEGPPPEPVQDKAVAETAAVGKVAPIVAFIVGLGSRVFSAVCGLYLFLLFGKRLPNDTFIKNVIALTPVALALAGLHMLPIPCVGFILTLLLISFLYGLRWEDVLNYPIAYVLAAILTFVLQTTALGLLALVHR